MKSSIYRLGFHWSLQWPLWKAFYQHYCQVYVSGNIKTHVRGNTSCKFASTLEKAGCHCPTFLTFPWVRKHPAPFTSNSRPSLVSSFMFQKNIVKPFQDTNSKPDKGSGFLNSYSVCLTTWWHEQQSNLVCQISLNVSRMFLCWLHKNLLSIHWY